MVCNWTDYSNPGIDEITTERGTTIDVERRRVLSQEAQQILTDEVALIYIAEPNFLIVTRDDIKGWVKDPDPFLMYWPLYREE